MKKTIPSTPKKLAVTKVQPDALLGDVRDLILSARQTVARGVNSTLVLMYWKIGERIHRDVLHEKRAGYGEEILQTLSAKLVLEFGRGFAQRNLASMVQFAEVFPDNRIVATLSQQLGWSHFVELIPLKKHLQRDFSLKSLTLSSTFSAEGSLFAQLGRHELFTPVEPTYPPMTVSELVAATPEAML